MNCERVHKKFINKRIFFKNYVQDWITNIEQSNRKLDEFEIRDPLGQGGFGNVFRGFDRIYKKIVAIKSIRHDYKFEKLERINKEVEIHKTLHHKNIVQYFCDFDDAETKTHYIVMEYCSNGDVLGAITKSKERRLPLDRARKYFIQLINALRYMHSKIIIHRDLKPRNMLLDADDNVKLCDFGLATKSDSLKLEENSVCGTVNFISPEMYSRKAVTLSSDIFSAGCVLYTMVVGKPPFVSENELQSIKKTCEGSFYIPDWVDLRAADLIRKLMNRHIDQRPSYDEILAHPFIIGASKNVEPRKCPFDGGCVDILKDGSILLDIFGHPTLFQIYPTSQKVEIYVRGLGNQKGKSHIYDLQKLPPRYHKRYELAMKIVEESEKMRPFVIWNTESGRFILFRDYSLGVLINNAVKIIPEGNHDDIRTASIAIVQAVQKTEQPRFPVVVGKSPKPS